MPILTSVISQSGLNIKSVITKEQTYRLNMQKGQKEHVPADTHCEGHPHPGEFYDL